MCLHSNIYTITWQIINSCFTWDSNSVLLGESLHFLLLIIKDMLFDLLSWFLLCVCVCVCVCVCMCVVVAETFLTSGASAAQRSIVPPLSCGENLLIWFGRNWDLCSLWSQHAVKIPFEPPCVALFPLLPIHKHSDLHTLFFIFVDMYHKSHFIFVSLPD